jgi:hypothetical protein
MLQPGEQLIVLGQRRLCFDLLDGQEILEPV